jgi:phosphoribosyl 1,2-cyclic phosphodiesterase
MKAAVDRHLTRSADDEPVLGAKGVALVAEAVPWLDGQPFYLVGLVVGEDLELTPRAVFGEHAPILLDRGGWEPRYPGSVNDQVEFFDYRSTLGRVEVTFFGARGSCPCAGESYSRYGGNTASVLVRTGGDELIVLDLGTGLRSLGVAVSSDHPAGGPPVRATALLTHLHFDHILGLPFFGPLRNRDSILEVYGPRQAEGSLADVLCDIVRPPFFPVPLSNLGELRFHELVDGDSFAVGDAKVRARPIPHHGLTLGYRTEADGRSIVYMPDHQQPADGGPIDDAVLDLCEGADVLVHDAQYTEFELTHKRDWGHSTVEFAVDLAIRASVGHLVLFHHDPSHDDEALDAMLERATTMAGSNGLTVSSAREGVTVQPGRS